MIRCLRMPVIRRLLAAYVLNELAWSVGTLALSVLVYKRTGSAIGAAAFFLCSQVVPALLSPALVARLDRAHPRRILPALYGLEAVLFGALAYTTHHFMLAPVLALTVADGAVAGTARSLALATRIAILKPIDLLHEGNALSNFGFSGAYMIGPAIGGAVVVAGGTIAALLVNCAFFATMGLLLAVTKLPASTVEADDRSALARLRAGVANVRADRFLSRLISLQTFGMAFFTITIPVEVVYAQHTLHAGPGGYGALMALWGVGCVAGSAAYALWRRRPAATLMGGSAVALALGFGIMAVAPSLVWGLVGSGVAGTANGVEWVAARTALQERTPERWMALTMGLSDSASQVAPGIGIILGGVITALTVSRVAFAVAAGGAIAFAIATPIVMRSAVGGVRPVDAGVRAPAGSGGDDRDDVDDVDDVDDGVGGSDGSDGLAGGDSATRGRSLA
ncbi:MAG: MFS transporter [Solirubrobacteraceae bacterium]